MSMILKFAVVFFCSITLNLMPSFMLSTLRMEIG